MHRSNIRKKRWSRGASGASMNETGLAYAVRTCLRSKRHCVESYPFTRFFNSTTTARCSANGSCANALMASAISSVSA